MHTLSTLCLLFLSLAVTGQSRDFEDNLLRRQLDEGMIDQNEYRRTMTRLRDFLLEAGGYPEISTDSNGRYLRETDLGPADDLKQVLPRVSAWRAAGRFTLPYGGRYADWERQRCVYQLRTAYTYVDGGLVPIERGHRLSAAPHTLDVTLEITVRDGRATARWTEPVIAAYEYNTVYGGEGAGASTSLHYVYPARILPLIELDDRLWEAAVNDLRVLEEAVRGLAQELVDTVAADPSR